MSADTSIEWRKDRHSVQKFQFLYHFLPHPHENKRATLLMNKSMLMYCLVLLAMTLLFRFVPKVLPGILGYASNINTADLLANTNEKRAQNGLPPLVLNDRLSRAAQKKAQHMFAKGYWAHIAPDGTDPWDFILGEGYDYVYAGENLAKNFSTSRSVVDAWSNSVSHRQNLLNANYTEIGFASVDGVLNGYQTTIVVQMFGKPRTTRSLTSYQREIQGQPAENDQVKDIQAQVIEQPIIYEEIKVEPVVDVHKATKILSLIFGTFIIILLGLDMWYSRKMGIVKINGHTVAHITFLALVIVSIWFVLKPGAIL